MHHIDAGPPILHGCGWIKDEEAVDRHVQTRYVGHLKFDRPG